MSNSPISNYATMGNTSTAIAAMQAARWDSIDVAALTPDTLLAYCTTRLRELDGKINGMMQEQGGTRGLMAAVGRVKEALGRHSPLESNDVAGRKEILEAYVDAARSFPPGPQRDAILREMNAFRKTACYGDGDPPPIDLATYDAAALDREANLSTDNANNKVVETEIKLRSDGMDSISSDMNQQQEVKMIQLQSFISQRQMAVQLTTNLIQKMNEMMMAPIANLK